MKIGVGSGLGKNPKAAEVAARQALAACKGEYPAAAIVFSSYLGIAHTAMLSTIAKILPCVPLIGGTTFGEICGPDLLEGSIVVWLLASPKIHAQIGAGKGMAIDPFLAAATATRQALDGFPGEPKLFVAFFEPQMGDPALALEGVKSVLGKNFPIVGAGTGSGLVMEQNPFAKQFFATQVLGGSFCGMLLGGDFVFSCGLSHGGTHLSKTMTLTQTRRNVIVEIDNRPALDVFEEALGLKLGLRGLAYLDIHAAIQEPEHPKSDTLRAFWGASISERTIYCGNHIARGAQIRFVQVRSDTILERQKESIKKARALLGRKVEGVLSIDCYGRKMTLGAQQLIPVELGLIHKAAMGAPLAGLYSGSEIGILDWGQPNQESRYGHQSTSFVLFGKP